MTAPDQTSGLTVALAVIASPFILGAVFWLGMKVRQRRADREWAAGIAERVHDRRYLDFLEEQFASEERSS